MKKKVIGKIYSTTDYDMFKYREDNRELRPHLVEKLLATIGKIGQRQAVSVDSDLFVIDGQHRIEVCRRLEIPVVFSIDDRPTSTNDLIDIQTMEGWNLNDRAGSFSLTDENYKWYNNFSERYQEFSHTIKIMLLCNIPERSKKIEQDFKIGNFKIKSFNKAIESGDMLRKFGHFYKGYKKRGFVAAILIMKQHKDFELSRLLRKMPIRSKSLLDFSKTEDYLEVLEEMYNWKETKKVYFTREN